MALPYSHTSLDPHGDGTLRTRLSPSYNIYEPLVDVDHDLRVRPGLATSWSTVDEHTWQFELREARFHSGPALGAADVVASLQRAAGPRRDSSYYLQDLESVRALGPRRVELRTRGPAPRFLNRLGSVMIVPARAVDLTRIADGTGPYAVESWEPGRVLLLRRNEAWWNGKPDVVRAELHFDVAGARAEEGLLAGRFEAAQFVAGFDPARVAASPVHRLVDQEDLYVTYLAWNFTRPPFSDRRVREAVSTAIGRATLASSLPRRAQPASQLVTRHVFGFDPALVIPPGDGARARAALARAGWPDGLAATLTVRERYRDVGEALARQVAAAGLKLTVEVEEEPRFSERLTRGELSLWLDNWGCTTGDAAELFENALHSRAAGSSYGRFNETGYANPALDTRIEAVAGLDADERRQALQELMRAVLDDHALVPLYSDIDVYGLARDHRWRPRADGSLRLADFDLP